MRAGAMRPREEQKKTCLPVTREGNVREFPAKSVNRNYLMDVSSDEQKSEKARGAGPQEPPSLFHGGRNWKSAGLDRNVNKGIIPRRCFSFRVLVLCTPTHCYTAVAYWRT